MRVEWQRMRALGCVFSLICTAGFSTRAWGEAPPRSESGLTLTVPEEHRSRGGVFWLLQRTNDIQVTFTSDARYERIVGISRSVTGYVVFDEDAAEGESPLVAAAYRLPVKSLYTGLPGRDRDMQRERWLNGVNHPDITFELKTVRDVQIVDDGADEEDATTWSGILVGTLSMRGVEHEIEAPSQFTLMRNVDRRFRGGGDMLAIRSQYGVDLADFGIDINFGLYVSRTITLDQYLLHSTASPDASVGQSAQENGSWEFDLARMNFLFTHGRDPDAAVEIAERLLEDPRVQQDADALMRIGRAELLAVDRRPQLSLARRALELAVQAGGEGDPQIHYYLARIEHDTGDLKGAVARMRQIVENIDRIKSEGRKRLYRFTLAQYERELAEETSEQDAGE